MAELWDGLPLYATCRRCGVRIKAEGYCYSCSQSVFYQGDVSWMADGACAQVDPELFFPIKGGSSRDAKALCLGDDARRIPACIVRQQCLQYSLENDERDGIWGGLSELERRVLRRSASEAA